MAIKFLDRGGSASQHVIARELLNHRECTLHPNIVQLKEVFLTPHHLGIALEYANGGDLSEFIDERSLRGVSLLDHTTCSSVPLHCIPLKQTMVCDMLYIDGPINYSRDLIMCLVAHYLVCVNVTDLWVLRDEGEVVFPAIHHRP